MEAQQELAAEKSAPGAQLSPEERERVRQKEGLILSRKRIAEQLASTQNPRYQQQLTNSLAELDARIAALS